MEESVGTLMRPFSHASQNSLDQITESRIMVATNLRLHAKRSRLVYDYTHNGRDRIPTVRSTVGPSAAARR